MNHETELQQLSDLLRAARAETEVWKRRALGPATDSWREYVETQLSSLAQVYIAEEKRNDARFEELSARVNALYLKGT